MQDGYKTLHRTENKSRRRHISEHQDGPERENRITETRRHLGPLGTALIFSSIMTLPAFAMIIEGLPVR